MIGAGIGIIIFIGWIIIVLSAAIFITCSIIFILNLITCIKNRWPKRNLVAVIITGIIISHMLLAVAIELMESLIHSVTSHDEVTTSSIETVITYLSVLL